MGEVVGGANSIVVDNGVGVGAVILDPQADNTNRATIILFIVLPFS
jgi:hypothetical protein